MAANTVSHSPSMFVPLACSRVFSPASFKHLKSRSITTVLTTIESTVKRTGKVTAGGSALFSIGVSLPAAKGGKHSIVKTRSMALIVCAARYQTTRWIPITLTKDIV